MTESVMFDSGILSAFLDQLAIEDRAPATVEKYGRDLRALLEWMTARGLGGLDAGTLRDYRHCLAGSRAPSSANSALSAVNRLTAYLGRPDLKLPFLRIQKKAFRDASEDLTRDDYIRLVDTAYGRGQERLGLVLETFGSTGMRASELRHVTVDAVKSGKALIDLKGKLRTVMFPPRLQSKLLDYCAERGISEGSVFLTRSGAALSRQEIWREMKTLCEKAGIPAAKVYPHNLRHMFATAFYEQSGDLVKLADVLGHSSVDTTRIYLITSGIEHARQLEMLGLVR